MPENFGGGSPVTTNVDRGEATFTPQTVAERAVPSASAAGALIALGIALWVFSAFGLDPGNVRSQRWDLFTYHLPTARRFAELPFLEALHDYPAATFPLFQILMGAVLALGGTVFAIQAMAAAIGAVMLALIYRQARFNRGFPPTAAAVLVATTLISPYFRGTTVYANTDTLSLALFLAAFVVADRPSRPSPGSALALACCAVWARQFYVFAPIALFLRDGFGAGRGRFWRMALIAAVMAAPVIALVAWWGGPTPPSFRQHLDWDGVVTKLGVVCTIFGLYALPSMVATARWHRAEFLAAIRRPAFIVTAVCIVLLAVLASFGAPGLGRGAGGGAAMVGLARFGVPVPVRLAVLTVAIAVVGCYLAYLVLQAPRANAVLLLVTLAFVPTQAIYQRYFDPLLPVLFACILRTRESETLGRSSGVILYPAVEFTLAVIGFIYYSRWLPTLSGV